MKKPDVIVSWPRNADYPVWRQMIRDNRTRFEKVIIVFTETHHGDDYRDFVRRAMDKDDVTFLISPQVRADEDWRNVAINFGLQFSGSQWIWFTEQDFFPEEGFWETVEEVSATTDVIATYEDTRLHPCNILITRMTLDLFTKKNFGIVPDKLDHFGLIQQQLEASRLSIYALPNTLYHHMAGLSHNMRLINEDGSPNHNREDFIQYLYACLQVSVPLDSRFKIAAESYFKKLTPLA